MIRRRPWVSAVLLWTCVRGSAAGAAAQGTVFLQFASDFTSACDRPGSAICARTPRRVQRQSAVIVGRSEEEPPTYLALSCAHGYADGDEVGVGIVGAHVVLAQAVAVDRAEDLAAFTFRSNAALDVAPIAAADTTPHVVVSNVCFEGFGVAPVARHANVVGYTDYVDPLRQARRRTPSLVIDEPTKGGGSGSGLMHQGELVGLVWASRGTPGSPTFAIPASAMRRFVEEQVSPVVPWCCARRRQRVVARREPIQWSPPSNPSRPAPDPMPTIPPIQPSLEAPAIAPSAPVPAPSPMERTGSTHWSPMDPDVPANPGSAVGGLIERYGWLLPAAGFSAGVPALAAAWLAARRLHAIRNRRRGPAVAGAPQEREDLGRTRTQNVFTRVAMEREGEAYREAHRRIVQRYPGAADTVELIEGVARQILDGKEVTQPSAWKTQ